MVPGGVAQLDGRLIPGDRLLFVNDINLENSSLDQAVQALKGAPKGVVKIGVAKPLPMADTSLNLTHQNHSDLSMVNGSVNMMNITTMATNTTTTAMATMDPDVIPEWKSK